MNDTVSLNIPAHYAELVNRSQKDGFTMPSDDYIGSLLRTLITSKPGGHLLELGTGMSLSLSWMIDGMDDRSTLISVDNDPNLIAIAKEYYANDSSVRLICADGAEWINNYKGPKFDLIFADAWPGKYSELNETLDLLKTGGFYVIDDMSFQSNWPDGHEAKVMWLIDQLEKRNDLRLTKLDWSTGVIIATKC
ncbi:MAG: class I SAM-dependent methyltransferase [Cyclobacteriaceae bacterium]